MKVLSILIPPFCLSTLPRSVYPPSFILFPHSVYLSPPPLQFCLTPPFCLSFTPPFCQSSLLHSVYLPPSPSPGIWSGWSLMRETMRPRQSGHSASGSEQTPQQQTWPQSRNSTEDWNTETQIIITRSKVFKEHCVIARTCVDLRGIKIYTEIMYTLQSRNLWKVTCIHTPLYSAISA